MQALDNYINEIKALPPAPKVLPQLLALLNEEDVHAARVVDLIAFDPALTAKVLQQCNNAASGLDHTVGDLHEAVTRLGFNPIYRMVALIVGEGLLGAEQPGYGIDRGGLWEHAVATAVSAKVIATELDGPDNLAFTAGLLHDIGKLVLSVFLESSQQMLLSKTGPSGLSFLEAEQSILGVEHSEIGGRLLQRWNFPENLVQAVWHHHDPLKARPHEQLAAYVHLGDIIAHCLGHAQGFESFAVHTRGEALQILEINPAEMDLFVLKADNAMRECQGLNWTTS